MESGESEIMNIIPIRFMCDQLCLTNAYHQQEVIRNIMKDCLNIEAHNFLLCPQIHPVFLPLAPLLDIHGEPASF